MTTKRSIEIDVTAPSGDAVRGLGQTEAAVEGLDRAVLEADEKFQSLQDELRDLDEQARKLKQFEKFEQDLEKTSDALERAKREVAFLKDGMEKAGTGGARLFAKDLEKAKKQVIALSTKERTLKERLESSAAEMKKAGTYTGNLADSQKRLTDARQKAIAELNRHEKALAKVAKRQALLQSALAKGRGAWDSLRSSLFNIKGALLSAAAAFGVFRAAQEGIETAQEWEDLNIQLAALEGSTEAAAETIKTLYDTFDPGLVDAATDSYIKMRQFGIEPTMDQIQALLDVNATLGGSQQTMEGIVLALGQAWAKQKLQGEEILQLVERGIPVWDLLQKVTGKTAAEIQDLSSAGKLGRDVIAAMIDEMGRANEGAATEGLKTWTGLTQTWNNLWSQLQITIFEGGLFDYLKARLTDINTTLEYIIASGKAEEWAQNVGSAVTNITSYVTAAVDAIQKLVGGLRFFINGFSAGVKAIGAAVTNLMATVLEGVAEVYDFFGATEWEKKAREVAGGLRAVQDEFVAGVIEDRADIEEALGQMSGSVTGLGDDFRALVDEAKDWKAAQEQNVTKPAGDAADSLDDLGEAATGATGDLLEQTKAAAAGAGALVDLEEGAVKTADAMKRLGLDIDALKEGVSVAAFSAFKDFDAAIKALSETELTAEQRTQALTIALGSVIEKAKDRADLDALERRLATLYDQGLIKGEEYRALVQQIADAHTTVAQTAEQARLALDAMYAQGTLSMEQYLAAIQDPIAALEELESLGTSAGDAVAAGANKAADALGREADAARDAADARERGSTAGTATSGGGGGGSSGGVSGASPVTAGVTYQQVYDLYGTDVGRARVGLAGLPDFDSFWDGYMAWLASTKGVSGPSAAPGNFNLPSQASGGNVMTIRFQSGNGQVGTFTGTATDIQIFLDALADAGGTATVN